MARIRKKELANGKPCYYPTVIYKGRETYLGGCRTRKNAEAAIRKAENQIVAGTFRKEAPPANTFGEFYLSWIAAKENSLKPSTVSDYRLTFRLHILPYFETKRLDKITPSNVQEWINSLELSPATTQKAYRYFRACIKQAENLDLIMKHPCRGIELPRVNKEEMDFLTPGEIGKLLQECREPEHTLFFLLAFSGLRLGEGLALRWRDVDFDMNCIKVERSFSAYNGITEPKTVTSRRAVPMLPSLAETLSDFYRQQRNPVPDALLFSVNGKTPLDKGNVRRRYYTALKAAGLKHVSIHSLRHSFASVMLASGASVKALQRSLGHAGAKETLDTYSHMIPENLDNVLSKADDLMTGANGKIVQLPKR